MGIPTVRDRRVAQGTQSCGEWSLYERPRGRPEAQDRSKTQPSLLDGSSVAAGLFPVRGACPVPDGSSVIPWSWGRPWGVQVLHINTSVP